MSNPVKPFLKKILNFEEEVLDTEEHLIRQQYPELVGKTRIINTVKQNWHVTDLIPLSVIALFFVSLIWWSGHYKPTQRIAELNRNIATFSQVFDDRATQVLRASTEFRQFLLDNELPEAAVARIDELNQSVSQLVLEKPSETTVERRFEAEARFTALAREITEARDLSMYGQLEPLPEDYTDQDVFARGRETITAAESWLDVLTPLEKDAKALLGEFLDKPMPKREGELRRFILNEWKTRHKKLMGQWKDLKTQELHWIDFAGFLAWLVLLQSLAGWL